MPKPRALEVFPWFRQMLTAVIQAGIRLSPTATWFQRSGSMLVHRQAKKQEILFPLASEIAVAPLRSTSSPVWKMLSESRPWTVSVDLLPLVRHH